MWHSYPVVLCRRQRRFVLLLTRRKVSHSHQEVLAFSFLGTGQDRRLFASYRTAAFRDTRRGGAYFLLQAWAILPMIGTKALPRRTSPQPQCKTPTAG